MNKMMNVGLTLISLAIAIPTLSTVIEIADQNHFNQIYNGKQPAIFKFSADAWCGACKMAQQPFEDLSHEAEFKNVQFAHVDVDGLGDLSGQHGIVGVPTFFYVQNGSKKGEMVGVGNIAGLKEDMRTHMRTHFNLADNEINPSPEAAGYDMTPTVTQELPPAQPLETEKGGIVAALKNLIKSIWNAIYYWFYYLVEKIKSLF